MFIELMIRILNKIGVIIRLDYLYIYNIKGSVSKNNDPLKYAFVGSKKDLVKISGLKKFDKHTTFIKRLDSKNKVYIAKLNGQVVGYAWVSNNRIVYPEEGIIKYFSKEITHYWYDVFISPQFRVFNFFNFIT